MAGSFRGQVQDTIGGHPEPDNSVIILGKVAILITCLLSLVLSVRAVPREPEADR
jgi:hypothetical protein